MFQRSCVKTLLVVLCSYSHRPVIPPATTATSSVDLPNTMAVRRYWPRSWFAAPAGRTPRCTRPRAGYSICRSPAQNVSAGSYLSGMASAPESAGIPRSESGRRQVGGGAQNTGAAGLPAGASDEGGDDVGGVAVEGDSGPVVSHGGSRIGVRRCFL